MGRQILSQEGHQVETASNGDEALEWLQRHQPDLVMLDTRMPGPSGYEVCQRIKQSDQWRTIKVVLLAGPLEPFDSDQANRVGSDAVLHKPLDAYSLIETVHSLIGQATVGRDKAPSASTAAAQLAEPVTVAVAEASTAAPEAEPAEQPEPAPARGAADIAEDPLADPFDELVKLALQQTPAGPTLDDEKVRSAVAEVLEASIPALVETISERILARLREKS